MISVEAMEHYLSFLMAIAMWFSDSGRNLDTIAALRKPKKEMEPSIIKHHPWALEPYDCKVVETSIASFDLENTGPLKKLPTIGLQLSFNHPIRKSEPWWSTNGNWTFGIPAVS